MSICCYRLLKKFLKETQFKGFCAKLCRWNCIDIKAPFTFLTSCQLLTRSRGSMLSSHHLHNYFLTTKIPEKMNWKGILKEIISLKILKDDKTLQQLLNLILGNDLMKAKVLSAAKSQWEIRCLPNTDWTFQVVALTLHLQCNNVSFWWTTLMVFETRSKESIEYSHYSFGSSDIRWKIDHCSFIHVNWTSATYPDLVCPRTSKDNEEYRIQISS